MYAKIEITGKIEVVTGMHIGGSSAFSAIGSVDSPIIKDPVTGNPMIPGSSLKGKMRTLLAKRYNPSVAAKPDDDVEILTNLFGSSKKNHIKTSRVLFSDMIMDNWEELRSRGLNSRTEIKFENTINRATAVANPRQIERAVRGSEFPMSIIYEVDGNESDNEDRLKEDFEVLKEGFRLLEYDYLGGNGSRGYGKVKFKDLQANVVIGEVSDETMDICRGIIAEI